METTKTSGQNKFLDSNIYKKPEEVFKQTIANQNFGPKVDAYLEEVLKADTPKEDKYQMLIKPILEELLTNGKKEEAGLLFNIHRILTEFRGYGANDKASSDVASFFDTDYEIPKDGIIRIDFFVTRNLPAIIRTLEKRNIDLSRLRIYIPTAILAAQLMQMNEEKRAEFEEACSKLNENQFFIEDVNHIMNVEGGEKEEEVAMLFSPRTMPITPELMETTEEATITKYIGFFKELVRNVVEDGEIFLNLAFEENYKPLAVEITERKRRQVKLSGISRQIASEVVKALIEEGFNPINVTDFDPKNVNPEIDHAKLAKNLHFKK